MSLMDMWTVCDRCSFEYRRRKMKIESTGWLVCPTCFDKDDMLSHPQNKAARSRRETRVVPGARAQQIVT